MIHANWQDRWLLLWDDRPGVDAAALRDAVGQIVSDSLLASVATATTLKLWLPADSGLEHREVVALQFSAIDAVDLLASTTPADAVSMGPSVDYWSRLARFVVDCITLQRFYPTARRIAGRCEAFWRLHLSQADLDALEKFTAAMPPLAKAIVGDDQPPIDRIDSFLAATADALIRRAAGNDPFFTRVHALANETDAGPELRFLSALLADQDTIPGDDTDNDVLVDQVQLWSSRLTGAAPTSGWQLGFVLIDPPDDDEEDGPWQLMFQLVPLGEHQAIEAAKIWADASPLSALGRLQSELRAVLMAELNRAAEIAPPLQRILATPAPAQIELSSNEAHQFLRQWSVELAAKSFDIILPPWADNLERQLSLVMALRQDDDASADNEYRAAQPDAGPPRMGLDSLLHFDWRISLGGMELSTDEFRQLVSRQSALVKFRGRWVELEADAAAEAAQFLQNNPGGQTTLGDAFRTAFASTHSAGRAPAITLTGVAWVRDLLEQLPALRAPQIEQPADFIGTLRPYQLRGLQWLSFLDRLGIGGCLADDMGLGKTIQLIALLLLDEKNASSSSSSASPPRPAAASPTLLFAPTSVVGNWVRELERFAPRLRVLLHHGPQRERGDDFIRLAGEHDVVITSYALAHRDVEVLSRIAWRRLALDEAQKIKNPSAASSIAIRALTAPRRIALTGTPVENHLSELWSIMDVLNPGLLGSAKEFRDRFAVPIEKLLDQPRAEHLRRMIRPFVLRRTKTDPQIASDLPEKIEMKVFCNLSVEQAAIYERTTAEMLTAIDAASGIRRRGLILAVLTRLKQICDHPALLEDDPGANLDRRSGKCERLIDMLEEVIEEGESALVFTQYAQMGKLLQRMLKARLRCPLHYLHGGTPQKQRDEMVQEFQASTQPSVFILSLRAGGLGLNLTAATHVFHFDRWWNPAVENQATDRAHRIGQSRRVQVHKFIAVGTVEERIDKLLAEKVQLAESIVGAGEDWLTELSTADLRTYLELADQAVGEF